MRTVVQYVIFRKQKCRTYYAYQWKLVLINAYCRVTVKVVDKLWNTLNVRILFSAGIRE